MNKTEQLSTSTQNPKIELPNKKLVGVMTLKKNQKNWENPKTYGLENFSFTF